MTVERIANGIALVDLHHDDRASVIAAAALETDGGLAIVDPGPAATIPALRSGLAEAGLDLADVHTLLATHIHLDHAGACGTLVRADPNIKVFVHQRGAPHMIDPSRLVRSATRLFGDRMDRLQPQNRIHAQRTVVYRAHAARESARVILAHRVEVVRAAAQPVDLGESVARRDTRVHLTIAEHHDFGVSAAYFDTDRTDLGRRQAKQQERGHHCAAPVAPARYSRLRETAIWIITAASGATTAALSGLVPVAFIASVSMTKTRGLGRPDAIESSSTT